MGPFCENFEQREVEEQWRDGETWSLSFSSLSLLSSRSWRRRHLRWMKRRRRFPRRVSHQPRNSRRLWEVLPVFGAGSLPWGRSTSLLSSPSACIILKRRLGKEKTSQPAYHHVTFSTKY